MNILARFLLLSLATISCFAFSSTGDHQKEYDFLIGDWQCQFEQYKDNQKVRTYPCQWQGKYTFDGHMVQDDFRMYADDKVVFSGTTLRTYVATKNRWDLAFLGSNIGHYPNFQGNWTGSEMAITNQGEDERGKFDVSIRFHDITQDSFTWEMKTSYDQGKTWELSARINATRR